MILNDRRGARLQDRWISTVFRLNRTAVILLCVSLQSASGQDIFRSSSKRSGNLLAPGGAFIKTIFSFEPAWYDTVYRYGSEPLLHARYREDELIRPVLDPVFEGQVKVYNPNFWGSIPQLREKSDYETFDTLQILRYLDAGWDTSLMIDDRENLEEIITYTEIPYQEIGGFFFFESWWLDDKKPGFYKDIVAYLPIREYYPSVYESYGDTEMHRRLLFMIIPEWSSGEQKTVRFRSGDFRLMLNDIRYDIQLYNKPYSDYLYWDEVPGPVSEEEFNSWQYHTFDFYRFFDPDLFLERIITGILNGRYSAGPPGNPGIRFGPEEFLRILKNYSSLVMDRGITEEQVLHPEDYPLKDLNSLTFSEDWYINPENLQIYKHVRNITLNRHESIVDEYTGELVRRQVVPLFTVYFE